MIVPPVPTPATKMSISLFVSVQISSRLTGDGLLGIGRSRTAGASTVLGSLLKAVRLARCAVHAGRSVGQHSFGSEQAEELLLLNAHRLGHGQHEAVASGSCHGGEADPGVATGGLDEGRLAGRAALPARRPRSC